MEAERRQRDVQVRGTARTSVGRTRQVAGSADVLPACTQAHLEQQKRFDDGMAGGMDLVVDCKFSEGLNDREIRSLCKQLQYSYGFNRRSARPVRLHFTSFTGARLPCCLCTPGRHRSAQRALRAWLASAEAAALGAGPVKDVADRWMSGQNWPVHKSEQGALDLFPRERIVVLSPDAEEPLLEVDPSKACTAASRATLPGNKEGCLHSLPASACSWTLRGAG